MQNLSREDSLLTLSGTAALTKWVCCRGKLLWTVWVQNTCEICEPEPVGTLRIATNRYESLRLFASKAWWPKWTTGLSRIRPGYATIAFGSKHLGKFWQKSCPTRTWNNYIGTQRMQKHYKKSQTPQLLPATWGVQLCTCCYRAPWWADRGKMDAPGHRVLASWWWWCYFDLFCGLQ